MKLITVAFFLLLLISCRDKTLLNLKVTGKYYRCHNTNLESKCSLVKEHFKKPICYRKYINSFTVIDCSYYELLNSKEYIINE